MNQRVNISAFRYAVVSEGKRRVIILTNDLQVARDVSRGLFMENLHIIKTKEIEAFKVNSFVGREFALPGYVGYDAVDTTTDLRNFYEA